MSDKIYCKHLKKYISISKDAVENLEWGWICDCGCWTGVAPDCHKVIKEKELE